MQYTGTVLVLYAEKCDKMHRWAVLWGGNHWSDKMPE